MSPIFTPPEDTARSPSAVARYKTSTSIVTTTRLRTPPPTGTVGQPTLRRRIKLGTFAALDQRIALRYAMTPMSHTETESYLAHHLALAGRPG